MFMDDVYYLSNSSDYRVHEIQCIPARKADWKHDIEFPLCNFALAYLIQIYSEFPRYRR